MERKQDQLFEPSENMQHVIKPYKSDQKQMTMSSQKSSWWSLDHLDLTRPSLSGRVPLASKRKELQVRCKSVFGETSLPAWWLCSFCMKCPWPPPEIQPVCKKRGLHQQSACLQSFSSDSVTETSFFLRRGGKPTGLSLPNLWILWSHLRSSESLMLFPEAGYLILQYNGLLKKVQSAEKWPILL